MVRDSGRERPFALESSRTSGYDDPLEPGIWEMSEQRGVGGVGETPGKALLRALRSARHRRC